MSEDTFELVADEPSDQSLVRQWLAAGVANAVTSGLLNPLDVAKTNMQSPVSGAPSHSMSATLCKLYLRGGVFRGLFLPGLSASMIREMLSSGPRAGFYVPLRDVLLDRAREHESLMKILAAQTCGIVGSLFANPIDVVKIRLMRDPTLYPSALAALPIILRAEGWRGLYRGVVPSTLRGSFIAAGELATYDIAKTKLREAFAHGAGEEGWGLHVGASLITGVVSRWVLSHSGAWGVSSSSRCSMLSGCRCCRSAF
jgi:hypothetical protein